jgi:catechol-2,3-dioxygenase
MSCDLCLQPEVKVAPWTVTHSVCWAMYAKDPKGNAIEFFSDTPWYGHQPFLKPMDFNIDSDTLFAETEVLLRDAPGFQQLDDFHKNLDKRIPKKEQA